jgi:hypothetical protein
LRVQRDSSITLRMTPGRGLHLGHLIPTPSAMLRTGSVESPERFFDYAQNDTWQGATFRTCHPDSFDCA